MQPTSCRQLAVGFVYWSRKLPYYPHYVQNDLFWGILVYLQVTDRVLKLHALSAFNHFVVAPALLKRPRAHRYLSFKIKNDHTLLSSPMTEHCEGKLLHNLGLRTVN